MLCYETKDDPIAMEGLKKLKYNIQYIDCQAITK